MAKRKLIEQAGQLGGATDPRSENSWHERMRKNNPELLKEITELVDDFVLGGPTADRFSGAADIWQWLSGVHPTKGIEKPVEGLCSESRFRHFVKVRRREALRAENDPERPGKVSPGKAGKRSAQKGI